MSTFTDLVHGYYDAWNRRNPEAVAALLGADATYTDPLTSTDLRGEALVAHVRRFIWLQAHRPQTLAVALHDSPLGAAAWMIEKFNGWSDGGVEKAFRIDDLITNLMLYVATGRVASPLWFYRGFLLECEGRTHPGSRVAVPTGVAIFPHDMLNGRPPRRWAERDYRIVHWSEMPRGGHFACLEQPELFVTELRSFFRDVEFAP
jgi:microsomal epoxide hydrolase